MTKLRTIPAGIFKAQCLKLMDQVQQTGEEIIVTKHGKPVVRLVPAGGKVETLFGAMKDSATSRGDIIGPFFDEWQLEEG
jgi:prevent-host-death family protein